MLLRWMDVNVFVFLILLFEKKSLRKVMFDSVLLGSEQRFPFSSICIIFVVMKRYYVCFSIAGSDPSGGAGIQADLKTFSALGCYGASAITALTVQNTKGVVQSVPVDANLVYEQITAVLSDMSPTAVKIGMTPTVEIIEAIVTALNIFPVSHVVLDPVMVSSSGCRLMDSEALKVLCTKLLPLCSLVTPNIVEAVVLKECLEKEKRVDPSLCMLLTGGDRSGVPCDILSTPAGRVVLNGHRVHTINDHGTGCTLSSAITAFLARGFPLEASVCQAKKFVEKALEAGLEQRLGGGRGGMNHFFAPEPLLIEEF